MFVADRMTKNPVTISPETSVSHAHELMRNKKFRRLPVVEGEKLVGWVTERDLREVSPSSATTLSVYEMNYLLSKLKISDVMQKDLVTVPVDAAVEEAALLMYRHKIGGMPVLDGNQHLVGIITETDIFRAFLDMMDVVHGATRFTLQSEDKIGVFAALSGLFARKGLSISSVTNYPGPDGSAYIVVRVPGDHDTAKEAVPDIELLGLKIIAINQLPPMELQGKG